MILDVEDVRAVIVSRLTRLAKTVSTVRLEDLEDDADEFVCELNKIKTHIEILRDTPCDDHVGRAA